MTSLSNSFQSTHPTGRVHWEVLLNLVITSGRVEFLSPDYHILAGRLKHLFCQEKDIIIFFKKQKIFIRKGEPL